MASGVRPVLRDFHNTGDVSWQTQPLAVTGPLDWQFEIVADCDDGTHL